MIVQLNIDTRWVRWVFPLPLFQKYVTQDFTTVKLVRWLMFTLSWCRT